MAGLTPVLLHLPPATPAFLLQHCGWWDPLLPYLPASGQAQAAASHDGQDWRRHQHAHIQRSPASGQRQHDLQHIIGPRVPLGTGGVGTTGLGAGRRKAKETGRNTPKPHAGLGDQSCCLPVEPGALCPYLSGNQQAPRPAAWASPSSCFLYGFLKLPAKTAKAKGSTCLSQAKFTCPSTLFYSQKFLPWPCRGQRKQETALMLPLLPHGGRPPGAWLWDQRHRPWVPKRMLLFGCQWELKLEDSYPTRLVRRKNSSPRGCSHGPDLLDLTPPMVEPLFGQS